MGKLKTSRETISKKQVKSLYLIASKKKGTMLTPKSKRFNKESATSMSRTTSRKITFSDFAKCKNL